MVRGFDFYSDLASAAVDSVMSEAARIYPRALPLYGEPLADVDREHFELTGILSNAPATVSIAGQKIGSETQSALGLAASKTEFWVSRQGMEQARGKVRRGDLLVLGSGRYGIAEVRANDTGDYVLILNREAE